MKFSDFLDVLASFLNNPVVVLRVSDSDDMDDLQKKVLNLTFDYQVLKEKYDSLALKYSHECQISMMLQDKLSDLVKENKNA